MTEGILRRPAVRAGLELGDLRALRDDDDAEQLALAPSPVQVPDDVRQALRKLRNDDEVRSAGQAPSERNPSGVTAHDLHDHDAMVCRSGCVQAVEGLGYNADRGVEADAEFGHRGGVI